MIDFKKIELKDKELITSYLFMRKERDCNLSFVNLCSWQFMTQSSFAIVHDCLVVRFNLPEERVVYLMPVGPGDKHVVLTELKKQAELEGHKMRLHGVFPDLRDWLENVYPGRFQYHTDRDYFDYIYLRQDLVDLKGKDFQPKRNHVNKFKKSYNYTYEPLSRDLIPYCLQLEEEWCKRHGCDESESLENERKALTMALNHFEELELLGGAICVEGQIVAFTYGGPITGDTFGVNIEKADTLVDGAYNIINQEFARRIPEQYIYVNREEDLGMPGLRKAKLSYRPVILLEKGYAELMD